MVILKKQTKSKKNRNLFKKALTMVEVLASITILYLVIFSLISISSFIINSYEEISIKGIIRRKVDEYYHCHIFTKYYLNNNDLGYLNLMTTTTTNISDISITYQNPTTIPNPNNPINTSEELYKRLNNGTINLANLLKDMLENLNQDEWIKSQQIQVTSINANLKSTIGYYKTITITIHNKSFPKDIYLVYTLNTIELNLSFEKRNRKKFNMKFTFYLVNNMKSKIKSFPNTTVNTQEQKLLSPENRNVIEITTTT